MAARYCADPSHFDLAFGATDWTLTAHAAELINISSAADNQFVLHAGFGQTRLVGFDAAADVVHSV